MKSKERENYYSALERANAIADMERRKDEALKDPDALEEKLRAAIDEI